MFESQVDPTPEVVTQSTPTIIARSLSMTYAREHAETVVFTGIDVRIRAQEFVVVVGPSGCGKSTLLKLLGGLVEPTGGTIDFAEPILSDRRVATVFQNDNLFPWMRAEDNVAFGLRLRGMARDARLDRARQELRTVGLEGARELYPAELSGGMRQRVNLARALAIEPQLMLMDEPFAALDVQTKHQMQESLLNIWERDRRTVVFVTHSIQEALLLGDTILVMSGSSPARIIERLDVPFERPRDAQELRFGQSFRELEQHIWSLLRTQSFSTED